jgi:hypothetical protein
MLISRVEVVGLKYGVRSSLRSQILDGRIAGTKIVIVLIRTKYSLPSQVHLYSIGSVR